MQNPATDTSCLHTPLLHVPLWHTLCLSHADPSCTTSKIKTLPSTNKKGLQLDNKRLCTLDLSAPLSSSQTPSISLPPPPPTTPNQLFCFRYLRENSTRSWVNSALYVYFRSKLPLTRWQQHANILSGQCTLLRYP
jgi:hypothetical protein